MALVETEMLPIMILWISEALSCLGVGFFSCLNSAIQCKAQTKLCTVNSQKQPCIYFWEAAGRRWKEALGVHRPKRKSSKGGLANLFSARAGISYKNVILAGESSFVSLLAVEIQCGL